MKLRKNEKKKLLEIIKRNSTKDMIVDGENKVNSKNLLSYITQINRYLSENKLEKKTIIIQIENRLHTLIFYLAAIFSKTTICPLDPKLPKSRVQKIKKLLNAKKIIKKIKLVKSEKADASLLNLDNHKFLITFSSGTSGEPKGIIHDSNNILGVSFSYSKLAGFNKNTRILHCLPEYYMAGIVNTFFSCVCTAGQVIVINSFSKRTIFDIWHLISKYRVNAVYLIPSIYAMISNFSPANAKQIIKKNKISFFSTSNNLYSNIRKTFFKKYQSKIKSCYGITEMGGPLTNEIKPNLVNDSVGQLINGCKIKIKEINKKKILFFKSEYMCQSLLVNNKTQSIKVDNQGYFNSEDTGFIEKKNIFLTGREKDVLKKGGELIHLKDIENIIIGCDFIIDVAAVGIADELSDEKLNIYLTSKLKTITKKNVDHLVTEIRDNMYKTELPDKIIFIKKMPKTMSGKIIKRELLSMNVSNKIKEVFL